MSEIVDPDMTSYVLIERLHGKFNVTVKRSAELEEGPAATLELNQFEIGTLEDALEAAGGLWERARGELARMESDPAESVEDGE